MRVASCLMVVVLLVGSGSLAALPGEQTKAGFIYVNASGGPPQLREAPDPASKVTGTPPNGTRLVYRKLIDPGTGPTWFYVEHPGGKAGWIEAKSTSQTRPTALPPAKPIKVVDTGIGLATPSSAQTAAARGLSPAAKQYAETKDFKTAVNEFMTLEKTVEEYFKDPHDAQGNYPDETVAERKKKGDEFRAGIK